MNYEDGQILTVPPRQAGSIEAMLSATGNNYAFMDYHHAPKSLRQPQHATLHDYTDAQGVWPDTFDGLFFINKVFPVERMITGHWQQAKSNWTGYDKPG